jgi:polar amino acid transport system substrate-binding protein
MVSGLVKSREMPKPDFIVLFWRCFFGLVCLSVFHFCYAQEIRIPLLIRELKNQNGETLPISDEIQKILAYIEQDQNLHFEIRRYPWNRLLQNAAAGEGLVFGMSKTKARAAIFRFSQPVFSNYVWLVTRSDATFPFATIQDLKAKSVGVVRGSSYGDEFDAQRNILFHVEEDVSSNSARLNKLWNRRMDVMLFGDRHSQAGAVENYLNQMMQDAEGGAGVASGQKFAVLPKPLLVDDLHFAIILQNSEGLIEKIDAAIGKGKKTGEFSRILFMKK